MGVCSSCLKQQPDQESEAAPLLAHQEANNKEIVQNPTEEVPEEGTINFHKSIIDDANGKFISSSSFKNHSRNQINAEEARIKVRKPVTIFYQFRCQYVNMSIFRDMAIYLCVSWLSYRGLLSTGAL